MAVELGSVSGWASVFGGALVGAAISGSLNVWLHFRTLKKAAQIRAEERKEVRKGQAFSLFVKLTRILSDGTVMTRNVDQMIRAAKEIDPKIEYLSLAVMPQSPSPIPVTFTPDELALVLSLDDVFFNEVAALDQLHGGLAGLNVLYTQKREELFSKFGAEMSGRIGRTAMSEEEGKRFHPRLIELEDILSGLMEFSKDCRDEGKKAATRWHELMRKEFGIKQTLSFKE